MLVSEKEVGSQSQANSEGKKLIMENTMEQTDEALLEEGRRVFRIEREAVLAIENSLDQSFVDAVRLILKTKGNVIFSGVGKSGHVARKLAATFASTGTTAYFVHADEAAHGDMGMIRPGDVFIGLSFSGESSELQMCIPALKAMGIPIIAMTGRAKSSLAQAADVALITPIEREACPLNLAPTASTTITMVLGDAIAGALMVAKDFHAEDFARSHPAGALGRRLLLKVSDVMRDLSNLPCVSVESDGLNAIGVMAKKHLGCFIVTDDKKPVGIFTEGDLSRAIKGKVDFSQTTAAKLMTANPKVIHEDESAFAAMRMIRDYQINQLIVVNAQNQIVGMVHVHDLIAAKVS